MIAHVVISIADAKVTGFWTAARQLLSGSEDGKRACFSWNFLHRHFSSSAAQVQPQNSGAAVCFAESISASSHQSV